jgi:hypothetical protein
LEARFPQRFYPGHATAEAEERASGDAGHEGDVATNLNGVRFDGPKVWELVIEGAIAGAADYPSRSAEKEARPAEILRACYGAGYDPHWAAGDEPPCAADDRPADGPEADAVDQAPLTEEAYTIQDIGPPAHDGVSHGQVELGVV